jgi:predicted nucleic acid-binding Zn ribbon protein
MPPSDHRHCKSCGRTCDPDDEVCSTACGEKRRKNLETRRNYSYLMYGMIGLLLILLLVGYVR